MRKNTKIIFSFVLVAIFIVCAAVWSSTPHFEDVVKMSLGSDRVLLSSDGEPLQTLRTDFKKRRLSWFPLTHFPQSLQESVILAEDQRFQNHFGFDPLGLIRAISANIQGKRLQGASTITMQLSDLIQKDVLLHNRKIKKGSLAHKITQIARAVLIELKWSKKEILEAYLNLIHLRSEFQGVPALTYAYLNKDPLALDPAESLVIASMISSPNQNLKSLKHRACLLYKRHTSSEESSCESIHSSVEAFFHKSPAMPLSPSLAPHLARRLFNEFRDETILTSTIQGNLQKKVYSILEKNIFRLKDSNVNDTAAIVIDNHTGQVLAYVGTLNTSTHPHVDGAMSYRQAGSSLKPFIYAKAIENKTLTAASILTDDPTAISWGGDVYRPSNYDKHFHGPVAVREALASSLNVPAVKAVTIIGLHETYNIFQSLRFSNLKEPDFYGVSMALGAVEVRLDELANAYRMLANGGVWSPLRFVQKNSEVLSEEKRILSQETAYILSSILSDPNARSIGFGWDTPLETPFWTAVKTGTSKDYRDNWCVGFSERYTVAVWAGNFNAEAMNKVSGVSGVGPSWYEIMNALHSQEPSRPPSRPANIVEKDVRHQWANSTYKEFFIKGTEPAQDIIEPSLDKRVQFVFPAEGSVLIKDPHLDQEHVALFVRFKGAIPARSQLLWNGKNLGDAVSPFKITTPPVGKHELSVLSNDGKVLSKVFFTIRGAE
ncbi:penicillin-binding protein 1C [Bdellovibrio bacteriovorus]|uniref:penicillin-binding protein 1C n=1 Tax=Bdellovibrio TaxID=958 RepID=UPI0035A84CD0